MARARLHIICGNCGCNDMFTYEIDPESNDISDEETKYEPDVRITCKNCATLHYLGNYISKER